MFIFPTDPVTAHYMYLAYDSCVFICLLLNGCMLYKNDCNVLFIIIGVVVVITASFLLLLT